ncbi:MAG: HAD family phosphatase [Nitrososphaerota archaeon]|jgi:hydroxymethylpyrimidine pyrophosphatase-like HAD family hydrolase|nr:HAD family phosphatase [Nitrososphaerota archaeon]MDG6918037.1 HAD family phosphatase [Nitrososphaerota archaeon]
MNKPAAGIQIDALATDLDGTLTSGGQPLKPDLVHAMKRIRANGVKLILVTGRCSKEAVGIAGEELFDAIVAENGAVLTTGSTRRLQIPDGWIDERTRLLPQFEKGCEEVIISSSIENLPLAKRLVSRLARVQVNKDRLMIMPLGVDKGSGLVSVLKMLNLSPERTACVGDGENDVPMFEVSGLKVALANSVDELKRRADYVAGRSDGEGTMEAIRNLFQGSSDPTP